MQIPPLQNRKFLPLFVLALTVVLLGCTTVGTGTRTLIRARCAYDDAECAQLAHDFPHLIANAETPDPGLVVVIGPNGTKQEPTTSAQSFAAYQKYRHSAYGSSQFPAARLEVNVHDRGAAAALMPVDVATIIANTLSTYAAANTKQPPATAIALQQFLLARLRNVADFPLVTVPHDRLCGVQRSYYYPQVSLDFGSVFFTPSILDKLDFLAVRVTLLTSGSDSRGTQTPRIVDYTPKVSDFADYTRGQLTTAAQLQAQLAYVPTKSVATITGESPDITTTTKSATIGPASGPQIGGTISDSYVAQLADAIERRTSGVFDGGRTFYADFRGIRNVRIGGTFNFGLMLEVPTHLEYHRPKCKKGEDCPVEPAQCPSKPGLYANEPVVKQLKANIALIGIVRHVYHRGYIGAFTKVPEAENDDVYEEVVMAKRGDVPLWAFNQEPAYTTVTGAQNCSVSITTNRDDGAFVLTGTDRAVLGRGTGRDGSISFPADAADKCHATVAFMPTIVTTGIEGMTRLLVPSVTSADGSKAAPDATGLASISLDFPADTPASVIAAYRPQ